ncbi:MAG: LarC family nickel insertion protein [Gemmatimonadales bacterium]|nr:MAG: LarC family nickel insertion protein [Gemmatimonadales bacterium]
MPGRLGLDGVTVDIEAVDRCGIRATKVTVRAPDGASEGPEGTPAHGPHRHLGELFQIVERAELSPWVRERALLAFRLLGEAEGAVHGVTPDRVSLHEVGALDALVDIVGSIDGFERLGVTEVRVTPVAVGSGWVRAAHGWLPIPAPATAILLQGLDIGPQGPVEGEATTPTGAVLLRVLSEGPPPEAWRPVASGWGAGSRNPEGYPNALRLMLAERVEEAAELVVLATDVDDMAPEYLGPLRAALSRAGAVDVVVWTTHMKKERVGFRIEAMVPPSAVDAATRAFFDHSTTIGVRRMRTERVTLARRQVRVPTSAGQEVRVKVVEAPGGPRVKPEYDDVNRVAEETGRVAADVASEVREAALRVVKD